MSRDARIVAQAKINLFLRVLAREASGWHQLETMFQRLALGDDVRVRVDVSGRALDCRGADVGPTEKNLAWRAAVAYADATGWPNGFAIEIDKRIPVGGGLGGGSADAGAVLRCLNALAPDPLGTADLLRVAVPLGADVPFLALDVPRALAWGRGERMLALTPLPERRVHLAVFDEGVNTALAYAALAEARHGETHIVGGALWRLDRLDRWDDVALVASNDFERVVLPMRADVAELRRFFADLGRALDADAGPRDDGDTQPIALMSGSGATVFVATPARAALSLDVHPPPHAPESDAFRIVETTTTTRVAPVVCED